MSAARKLRDANIAGISNIPSPREYWERFPVTPALRDQILGYREQAQRILAGQDRRILCVIGPCSIHDPEAGLEYAARLCELARKIRDSIFVVLRAYFEKPRTNIGWKGLIHDPDLNGTLDMRKGLEVARKFLLRVGELGVPVATEFVDLITPQYIADCVTWAAIGARTAESQAHRQLASGLSMPVGFKNGTGGSIKLAVDGVLAAQSRHGFLSVDEAGMVSQVVTTGNPWCHIVLRGSEARGSNYDATSVAGAQKALRELGLRPCIMVDCSHGNSKKDHLLQAVVLRDVITQRKAGNLAIIGFMMESHLKQGSQKPGNNPSGLAYGLSITDPCMGWEATQELLLETHHALGSSASSAFLRAAPAAW